MVFSSLTFLCLFLPVVVLLHTFLPNGRMRNAILLVASLLFYAWGEPVWIVAMLFATAVNYICARIIDRTESKAGRRAALVIGLCISLAALLYFKYAAFLVNSVCALFGLAFRLAQPKLPIGISFYTFQIITYTVDVYRKDAPVQKNPLDLLLYVCLFPQLIAGPIVRYGDVAAQLQKRTVGPKELGDGFVRFAIGLGKKVLLANLCGEVLESLPGSDALSFAGAWLAAVLFALQLYFDFAGYSDMAIGLGRILGFHFNENFNYPYISGSITEFWRRWHMSLGTWFRDYVYIPLGGNRVSKGRWVINILTVWMLTGAWHGAAWNFVLWGLLYALLLLAEKGIPGMQKLPAFLRHGYVLLITMLGFVLFNAESLNQATGDFFALLGLAGLPLVSAETLYYLKSFGLLFLAGCIGATPIVKQAAQKVQHSPVGPILETVLMILLLLVCTAYLVDGSFSPFLYFRF